MPPKNNAKAKKALISNGLLGSHGEELVGSEGVEIEHIAHGGLNARIVRSGSGNALIEFLDTKGRVMNTAFYPHIDEVMCFTPHSKIMTPKGPRRAENLKAGDLIITRDNGVQALAWIGRKVIGLGSLIANPALAPVTIAAGALGNGCPENTLVVSPNHRILTRDNLSRLMLEASEVLVPAQSLVGQPGITQSVPNSVTYLHLMFEQHELVMSEGVWSESFQPTKAALRGVELGQKADLFSLFPELKSVGAQNSQTSVRLEIKELDANYLPERCM